MFNKLRIKLTLTNVAVVSFIFCIFVTGIFLITGKITEDQANQLMSLVASNAELNGSQEITEQNDQNENQFKYFYVLLNTSGEITTSTKGLDVKQSMIKDIISRAMNTKLSKGKLKWNEKHFNFEKTTLDNGRDTSIIFVDTTSEHDMLDKLWAALALASLAGLILSFFGSLFIANRSLVPIKESWKEQKDFVADASHELRTPLSIIETTLDLLSGRKDKTIQSQLKWFENIQTENKRMTKLVNDLLFLARTDSGQVILDMKAFPLHLALLEAYIPFEALVMQKKIHLKQFEGSPVEFYGDEERIKQLAIILIDNAIKHTPSGGSVGMALRDLNSAVEISITDTGEGIDKEHLNKIFQRFYRVDKARSRKDGSTGLGLSIAEWIVKQHNGVIKVDSLKGSGTSFQVTLPKTR